MKIIHTADWHIGQIFFNYDRKAEHSCFFEWLQQQIQELQADVLLVAGDIFDSPNPSAESQRMYYRFLRDITSASPDLQIIITAGNHDSAARLEAPAPLLESMNVTVRGVVKRTADGTIDFNHLAVQLNGGGICMAVPYLRQGDCPDAPTYAQSVQKMYNDFYRFVKDKGKPVIIMGHLQATGAEISETDGAERTVIGGLECVSASAFAAEADYVALGHLHRTQKVSGHDSMRYAGAPLPMSFAEKNNRQGILFVETGAKTTVKHIAFDAPVKLLSIPATPMPLNDVLNEIDLLPDGTVTEKSPFIEIKIAITEPEPSLRHRIVEALKTKQVRLARITATIPQKENQAGEKAITYDDLQTISPVNVAADIFKRRYGQHEMPDRMRKLLEEVIREIE